ncbi:MAG: Xaa-Pro aminopeptidase [Akkermansia sp.]|nr:aminopeptidase P N-terminal domain-containing protein [Akkermansia sp.]MDO4751492.1 Xaa-Pro aminopeptidase [Akkermansia sp.]
MHTLRYEPISAAFYKTTRDQLAAQLPAGSLVIVHSNDIYPTNADGTLPHHQNANLFYLTGIDQEESVLLMRVQEDGKHEDTLLLRETNEHIVIWEGARLTKEDATALSGIDDVRWTDEYNALLAAWVPAAKKVWLERDNHPRRLTYVQTRNERMAAALLAAYPDVELQSLYDLLAGMRLVKSEAEIAQLREACRITGEGWVEVLRSIKPGMGEWEIEALLSAAYIRRRARKFSFHPIIASGKDTCVLHYISNHKCCAEGDLILFDIGAEYGGYAGDMTRTIPANGKYSPRQKAVYEACLAVHRYARDIMRPGLKKSEYERLVRVRMAAELVKLGLLSQQEVDAAPENPLCVRKYFMHGTSHSLGIDVHDVGPADPVFAENQVWTIEPGIYIPEESIGIRIETDVLIHADYTEDLIPNAPLDVADIEALMAH